MMITSRLALAAAVAGIPFPAFAADAADATLAGAATAAPTPGSAEDAHHAHGDDNGEVIVTGIRRRTQDVLGGISVLDAADLTREIRPSIGETLARQPGVSATSFGPAASAPVLRGLTGDRVRVLTDGIGSLDLSSSGPDHAIAINPVTAERIEVLRGPAALLFGSSAIGGVVNVIDTRIPRSVPENVVGLDALAGYGTAANERLLNGALDVPLGGPFVAHVDGNWTKSDDLRTGGHILPKDLREQALASPDPEIQALADLKGDLPNSAGESKEGALGFAYVDGGLNIGASVTRHETNYQVPIRYSLDPAVEPEAPTIDQKQTRYDFRAEIPVQGFLSHVRVRGGYANYRHFELEDTGEIATRFFSKGGEGRIELVQTERSGWGGTSGFQYLDRNARIRGEEKFLPDSEQRQAGLFTLQTLVSGPFRFEGGARVEFSKLDAEADDLLATPARSRDFTTFSASLGGQFEFSTGWRAGLTLSRSARAPSIDELFANGPHAASQSFEIGDPTLDPERSVGVEASVRGTRGPIQFDLPVFQYRAGKADFYGFEAQLQAKLGQAMGINWTGELQADAVRATVKNFGPAPFMPPFRVFAALLGERGQFDGRLELERAFAHNRTAPVETDTPGYTMVNASLDWHPLAANPELSLSLAANNIFDVEARRSTSQLKDFAPLAGRDFRLTARLGL